MTGFRKAERQNIKIKLAVTGPSGSGKTFSAIRLARGLGPKIAVIDSENGSASLYSDKFEFDVLEIGPPFTVQKYTEAIDVAVKAGYDVLVIDSLSHLWAGEGGLLEQKEALDNRGGKQNSYANWATITKSHELFKSKILQSDIHLIGTMRSKQDYAQQKDEATGKTKVEKLGMAPIQREGLEYDFSVVFDIAISHYATASKDRTGLFTSTMDQRAFVITEETGHTIKQWLDKGSNTNRLKQQAVELVARYKIDPKDVSHEIQTKFAKGKLSDLDDKEITQLLDWISHKGSVTTPQQSGVPLQ